ncbi:MAG: VWA domain-containing protein [Alphaproteobacteria bacterium PRO2]|nr:VWA domain-containing protein [Alphaproteobacteria bacterium PRO2]
MDEAKLKKILENIEAPAPDENARKTAVNLAVAEFKSLENQRKNTPQGNSIWARLTNKTTQTRSNPMQQKSKQRLMYGGMATAMAVILIVGITTQQTMVNTVGHDAMQAAKLKKITFETDGDAAAIAMDSLAEATEESSPAYVASIQESNEAETTASAAPTSMAAPVGRLTANQAKVSRSFAGAGADASRMMMVESMPYAPPPHVVPLPEPINPYYQEEGRDKFQDFKPSPVKLVADEPVSTFSIDVDTASYSLVRRELNNGIIPNPDAVRIEELVNYFDYNYPLPETREQPFKPTVTVTDSPWSKDKKLVHIGIKGFDVQTDSKPHSNLVFLVDVSGSMNSPDKLPLVKSSLKMLLDTLQPNDTVALTVYAGSAGTVLEPTKVSDKQTILNAIDNLNAGGSTAGAAGIEEAYRLAEKHFDKEGVNRVFIATDGDFNVGVSSDEDLKTIIEKKRESGIFLSVLGFGLGNLNDSLMQTLAQNGNGTAAYIDTINEARKVLVEEASSTLFPIAKDVKIQVEFNPELVQEYRLIGYETRALNREDFNNDKIDAGDIGAGHTVTAIYEITPAGVKGSVDPSRYAAKKEAVKPGSEFSNELGFLKMRYKLPHENESKLISTPIPVDAGAPNADITWATAVAGFGQLLKGDTHIGNFTYDDVIKMANEAKGADEFGQRAEFINLVRNAKVAAGK